MRRRYSFTLPVTLVVTLQKAVVPLSVRFASQTCLQTCGVGQTEPMSTPFSVSGVSVLATDGTETVHTGWTVVVGAMGTIEYAGPDADASVPAGYRRLDGTGKYLIPGLINAHAHLFSDGRPLAKIYLRPDTKVAVAKVLRSRLGQVMMRRRATNNAATQLHTGVTTIRTVGDVATEVIALRDRISRGELLGPRLLPSGPLLAITNGHGAPQIARVADTPEQASAGTRANLTDGARSIKISATGGVTDAKGIGHAGTPEMSEESMRAVCVEAHTKGVLVAAHAQSTEGVRRALRAGVDTIEHGSSLDQECIELFLDNPASLRGWSALIPTLQACLPLVKLDQSVTGIDDVVRANATLVLDEMVAGIGTARQHGIPVGMGTDSGVTYVSHSNTWRELDHLVRFGGLTRAEALQAATQINARILGMEAEIGSVEAGKAADLVLLDENPLDGLRALESPRTVIVRGTLIESPAINRLPEIDAQLDSF